MTIDDEKREDVAGDMTPMIDIIFLLLIFFLLTTSFIPEEQVVANLLPTQTGQRPRPVVDQVQPVNVLIYPHDRRDPTAYARGAGGVQYFHQLWASSPVTRDATLRIGNSETVCRMHGDLLARPGGDRQMIRHLRVIHDYLAQALARADGVRAREERAQMDPIVIQCFSGLPWKYALVAYDGIRAYEAAHGGAQGADDLSAAREVAFAPPRLRAHHEWELGKELNEIIVSN
ncbi:MAG: biopolymer transporter ExbD [Planctomycetota bacterium]